MSAAQENIVTDLNRETEGAGEAQEDARAALQAAVPYLETLHSIVGGEARASVWRCIERGRAALAARQPVCGTCAEVIQPDGLTGTTCSCARQPQAGKYDQSAEDRFEQFVQAEIARSPDALRELGEYLGRVLDEDEFPQANSLLLQLATEYAAPPAQGIDPGQVREIRIPARNNLDPICVFVQDQAAGRGRIVVTCYGNAWQGFWGAMGERNVMEFVAQCDADYVAGNMISGRQTRMTKAERAYTERISAEVIAEFRTLLGQRDAAPGVANA